MDRDTFLASNCVLVSSIESIHGSRENQKHLSTKKNLYRSLLFFLTPKQTHQTQLMSAVFTLNSSGAAIFVLKWTVASLAASGSSKDADWFNAIVVRNKGI